MPCASVVSCHQVINDAITDGDYSQEVGTAVVRFVQDFHRENEAKKKQAAPPATKKKPPPPPGPPPPQAKKEAKKRFSLFGSKKSSKEAPSSASDGKQVDFFGATPKATADPSPLTAPQPTPASTSATAMPPPLEASGDGGDVDTVRARNEARDLWEEIKAGEMTLEEVQDFVNANVKDGDYSQATANEIARLVLVAAAVAGMKPPPPPPKAPQPSQKPPPPAGKPPPPSQPPPLPTPPPQSSKPLTQKGGGGLVDTKRSINEASALWATLSKDKVLGANFCPCKAIEPGLYQYAYTHQTHDESNMVL